MIANAAITGSVADIARFRPGDHISVPIRQQDGAVVTLCYADTIHNRMLADFIARHEPFAASPAPNAPPHDPSDKLGEGAGVLRDHGQPNSTSEQRKHA